jgi:RHS repeat-associated protein
VYALQDANWNTTAIIAATGVPGVATGAVINRFAYTPYGESQTLTTSWASLPAGSTPAVPWGHLFQGLEFTDVTALAFVRHRDYSATLGRFIELDPIGFEAGDNNWYRFVANGPTGKTDPSGLKEECVQCGCGGSTWTGTICRAACWAAGGAICAAVSAGCTIGSVVTVGGLAIPCTAVVIASCAAAGGGAQICSEVCPP